MKFKLFFLLLVLFFSLGVVYADGNFTELQTEINESTDTIEITQDYAYDNSTDYPLNRGIQITQDDFIVNGNGHTIDGSGQSRIFEVTGNNVTLLNLILINGFSNNVGSAVFGLKNITVINCTFENNVAQEGGAMALAGVAIVENSTFMDNNATQAGALSCYNDTVILNSLFIGNIGSLIGGAMVLRGNTTVMKSNFTDYSANFGGAIYALNDLVIDDCIFSNSTSEYATAIYAEHAISVLDSTFENLHANVTGGAIGLKSIKGTCIIENSTFTNTSAVKNGGAIFADILGSISNLGDGELIISSSSFINSYGDFGGAVVQLGGNLTVEDSSFDGNTAMYNGAAIFTSFADVVMKNSYFDSNKIIYQELFNGGAIYCDIGRLSSNNSIFKNNSKNAVYAYDTKVTIIDSEFENNGEAVHVVFGEATLINNTYCDDTLVLNDTDYTSIASENGRELNLINNTIDVETLPSRFDSREWGWISPVRDQGFMGSCWTFGETGALESALIKATGVEYDLSENNMRDTMIAYSKYGATVIIEEGDEATALQYLLCWLGALPVDDDSYDQLGKLSPIITDDKKIHVYDVEILRPHENFTDNDAYKRAIMKYGSIALVYNACQDAPGYNKNTSAQYQNDSSRGDHCVSIVGWDDNYPASNFIITPPGDGAWIFKNSWGTSWGDNGFAYISYYDVSVFTEMTSTGYIIENTENYKTNYQTDLGGEYKINESDDMISYKTEYMSIGNELISAVGTYFDNEGEEYLIEIYVNGELKCAQNGTAPFYGYHTVRLSEEIPIQLNDNFTAVMTKKSVPIVSNQRHHVLENTAFVDYGSGWKDLALDNKTVTLKVYTKELSIYTQDMVKIYKNSAPFEANIGVANETVTFEINGVSYNRTSDKNGTAKISINLNPGNYTIKTTFNGTAVENSIRVLPTLIAENLVKYYRNESQFYVSLIDVEGKPAAGVNISMNINGVFYNRTTDENGTAKLNINLNPGEYILTATDPLTGLMMSYNITVLPTLTAEDLEMTYNDGSKFEAKLVDGKGNPLENVGITFNINGVFYTRYTNSSGIAVLNINLMSGEYIITSSYESAAIANRITIKS